MKSHLIEIKCFRVCKFCFRLRGINAGDKSFLNGKACYPIRLKTRTNHKWLSVEERYIRTLIK